VVQEPERPLSTHRHGENQVIPHLAQTVHIDELLDVVRGPFAKDLFIYAANIGRIVKVITDCRFAPPNVDREHDGPVGAHLRLVVPGRGERYWPGIWTQELIA
jgi:hypothetical protein